MREDFDHIVTYCDTYDEEPWVVLIYILFFQGSIACSVRLTTPAWCSPQEEIISLIQKHF